MDRNENNLFNSNPYLSVKYTTRCYAIFYERNRRCFSLGELHLVMKRLSDLEMASSHLVNGKAMHQNYLSSFFRNKRTLHLFIIGSVCILIRTLGWSVYNIHFHFHSVWFSSVCGRKHIYL